MFLCTLIDFKKQGRKQEIKMRQGGLGYPGPAEDFHCWIGGGGAQSKLLKGL